MTRTGITDQLIGVARVIRWESIPAEVRAVAAQCLLDHLGCALAGCREPPAMCDATCVQLPPLRSTAITPNGVNAVRFPALKATGPRLPLPRKVRSAWPCSPPRTDADASGPAPGSRVITWTTPANALAP